MNKILLLAGVSACLFAANANALEVNPYVGAKLRYVDMSTDVNDTQDVDEKVMGGRLAVGTAFKTANGAIRTELEYNRNEDAEKTHDMIDIDNGTIFKGKLKVETQSVMLNGYYDFDTGTKLTPYVGAGIGYAKVKGTLYVSGVKDGSIDDNNFAWQAGFGAGYALTDNVTFDAGYRYVDYGDFTEDSVKVDTSAHELYAGLRYSF